MLAFDLETTGLNPETDLITCAAAYAPEAGVERVFFFSRGDDPEEFLALLDGADRLCAFNGARFDIPFLQAAFKPAAGRVLSWRLKLHDVYEACRLALCVTFPLQALLDINGLAGMAATGRSTMGIVNPQLAQVRPGLERAAQMCRSVGQQWRASLRECPGRLKPSTSGRKRRKSRTSLTIMFPMVLMGRQVLCTMAQYLLVCSITPPRENPRGYPIEQTCIKRLYGVSMHLLRQLVVWRVTFQRMQVLSRHISARPQTDLVWTRSTLARTRWLMWNPLTWVCGWA